MVRIRDMAIVLGFLILAGVRPSSAGPMGMTLTGNVATDFPAPTTTNPTGVQITNIGADPSVIAGPNGSTPGTLVAGWDIQDIRTYYNASTDTMYVGIQGYKNVSGQEEIFGDSTGNPNAALDPNPNFGGDKSVAISFAPITSLGGKETVGTSNLIAGIPADKSKAGTGIDGFTVSQNTNMAGLPQYSFGQQLAQFTGNLAFNPSAAQPDLEFTIKNFSQIPGLNAANGYYMQVYAGSGDDSDGEVQTGWILVPASSPQQLPEPTTWLVWVALAGGAAWRYRRSLAARP